MLVPALVPALVPVLVPMLGSARLSVIVVPSLSRHARPTAFIARSAPVMTADDRSPPTA